MKSEEIALRNELQSVMERRSKLMIQKRDIETKLATIKNLIRKEGLMPGGKYAACCEAQNKYRAAILKIEKETSELNIKRSELGNKIREFEVERPHPAYAETDSILSQPRQDELRTRIIEIKSEYQKFAADQTRILSMRTMAGEFVVKLTDLLRKTSGHE